MQQTIAGILAALDRIAVHNRDEHEPSRPRGPASPGSIDRIQEARGRVLPSAYVEFLRLHDGWPGFPWGVNLFGTEELTGAAYEDAWDTLEICNEVDDGVPAELMNATIIANSDNDPELVLLLDSGDVVEFLYAEYERHADLAAYLAVQRERVEKHLAAKLATQAEVEADWDAEHRAAKEAQLLEELRVLPDRSQTGAQRSPAPPALDPAPATVTATDLAVRDEAGKDLAVVRLNLVLYLGAYPSPAEVLACFRAFRRRFPIAGTMRWGLPSRFGSLPTTADDPDDESWADRMRVESGFFGIRLSVGGYTLNVCGIPASDDGAERASFCEVIVPAAADHEQLARLADDLVAVLPVRSGHGGFSAYASERAGPEPYGQIFAWCQRLFALDVGYVDGFLESTSRRVLGAGWLTVLGRTFTQYLTEHAPRRLEAPGIDIRRTPRGLIIRAGDAPTLGDVQRGEFPTLMADVDEFLQPLKANAWHRTSTISMSGHGWSVQTHDLPGAFTEHRATAAWLARFADPATFLAAHALPADPPT